MRDGSMLDGVSKILELVVLRYYSEQTGKVLWCPVGEMSNFDGTDGAGTFTVEIKLDLMAMRTKNLAFEHSCNGRCSGLTVTTAHFWVSAVPHSREKFSCFEFETAVLREVLSPLPLVYGGDNRKSAMKLLPIETARNIVNSIFTVSVEWEKFQPTWS